MHTDSQYVQKGISEWIHGWKKKGWMTAAKTPVKNADLWKRLDALVAAARDRVALGDAVTTGIRKTSAPMRWPIAASRRSREI